MISIDMHIGAAARARVAARILSALPIDGSPVGYAPIASAAGDDAGPVMQGLIDQGLVRHFADNDDTAMYARAA